MKKILFLSFFVTALLTLNPEVSQGALVSASVAPGFTLSATQYKIVGKTKFILTETADFQAVDVDTQKLLWHSNTNSECEPLAKCYVSFQGDGNLVLHGLPSGYWTSFTDNKGATSLTFSEDGSLDIKNAGNAILWSSKAVSFSPGNFSLVPNQYKIVNDKKFLLTSTGDFQILNHYTKQLLWHSNTKDSCNPGCYLKFMLDGNMVLIGGAKNAIWNTSTELKSAAKLILSGDGVLSIKNSSADTLWSSEAVTYVKSGLVFNLKAGEFKTIDNVKYLLTADANFQILNARTSQILFQTNTHDSCESNCRMTFQPIDGNLAIYGSRKGLWSTGTDYKGQYLTLTPEGALLIKSTPTNVVWSSKSDLKQTTSSTTNYSEGVILRGNESKTINGLKIVLTATGDFQIINAISLEKIFATNTKANCSLPANCKLEFLGDGNLVLKTPVGPLWNTATYNVSNKGSYITFSGVDKTLTVKNFRGEAIWSSGKLTSPVPPLIDGLRYATPAKSFIESFGINSHMDQSEGNAAFNAEKINAMGLVNLREHYLGGDFLERFKILSSKGLHFNIVTHTTDIPGFLSGVETLVSTLGPDSVRSIEGLNEINNFSFSYNGSSFTKGVPNDNGEGAADFMTSFYAGLKNSLILRDIPMLDLTAGSSANRAESLGLLDIKNHADYANIHTYPSGQPRFRLLNDLAKSYTSMTPQKTIVTESGYSTEKFSLTAQKIMTMNLFLDAYDLGFKRLFLYTLTDDAESFGVYYKNHNPKPVVSAIHNLMSILADDKLPAVQKSLTYKFTGLPATAYSMLLQKSDGRLYLAIWNEPNVFAEYKADQAYVPVPFSVTLGSAVKSIAVYRPADSKETVRSLSNQAQVNLSMGLDPIILEITQ